jgi:hypothetical protein
MTPASRPPMKEEEMEWMPIETAPKDGTTVLTYRPTTPPHFEGMHWVDGDWYWSYDGDGPDHCSVQPTHWMPILPPPPKEQE